ncbi:putative uncharacterized protein [Parachlamydia acanthamoebae UV-7]|uniref:Uncharacterized protein n=2 Tax=Parachlamydia acanthamoebae TaxID=83552 RepID=F8L040_PARAV|nr:hypothetical protein [Parachlamydia acanthamoebae]CCB86562.1 putative uncharacterized protein [Parachlamydia acanthamoebae UV-7]
MSPPNTIYESASTLLTQLKKASPNEVFRKLILYGAVSGQHTVLPEATWFAVFNDFFNVYSSEFSGTENNHVQLLLIELLQLISQNSLEDGWKEIKEFLLRHIDVFSGWNRCWQKDDLEERKVFRGEDGNY